MRVTASIFIFIITALLFCSCKTTFPVSRYAKYNEVQDSYLYYYSNDSLGLGLDLFGRQRIEPGFKQPKLTPQLRQILKERTKGLKAKMFYASRSTGRYFGYKLYGFVFGNRSNQYTNQLVTKRFSSNGTSYYSDSDNIVNKNPWRLRATLVPLKDNRSVLFIWVQEIDTTPDSWDSETQQKEFIDNTNGDLSTLATASDYKSRRTRMDSLLAQIQNLIDDKDYVKPISKFNNMNEDSIDSYGLTNYFYQMKATAYSFVDDLDSVMEINPRAFSTGASRVNNDEPDSLIFHQNYKESIDSLASAAQVLMFNESHYDWRNRWLVTGMLPELKRMGYKYLCMEALSSVDSANMRGFPSLNDGIYYKEPFMGNLLRTALDLGFKIVQYEDTITEHNSIDERERAQAANLYNQFKHDPTAKWIVYAGYAHINKDGFSKGQLSMMQYFQKLSSANIRCVNQTKYSPFFYGSVNTGYSDNGFFIVKNLRKKESDADLYTLCNLVSLPYEDSSQAVKWGYRKYRFTKERALPAYLFVYAGNEYISLGKNAIPLVVKKISGLKNDFLFLPEKKYVFFTVDNEGNKSSLPITESKF